MDVSRVYKHVLNIYIIFRYLDLIYSKCIFTYKQNKTTRIQKEKMKNSFLFKIIVIVDRNYYT